MTIRVLLFARYRELAGAGHLDLEAAPGATLATIWDAARRRAPGLPDETPLMAVDRGYARADRTVAGGEEIAFFPPVSGG